MKQIRAPNSIVGVKLYFNAIPCRVDCLLSLEGLRKKSRLAEIGVNSYPPARKGLV